MGDTDAVSVKLKAYVALVCTVGATLVVGLAATVDLDRLRHDLPAVGLFAAFIIVGELLVVPIRHRGQVRELTVTNTFAYALVLLAGTAIGVLVLVAASAAADLARRKAPIKVAFNAAQWAIALAAAGGVYRALGGDQHIITAASVPALVVGGAVFLLTNHALVGI